MSCINLHKKAFKLLAFLSLCFCLSPMLGCQHRPWRGAVARFCQDQALNAERAGHLSLALAASQLGLRLDDQDPFAYYIRGIVFLDKDEYLRAVQDFSQTLALADLNADKKNGPPDRWERFALETPWIFLFRGRAYMKLGEDEKAAADLQRALSAAPESAAVYFELGVLSFKQSRYQDASSNFFQVIRFDPENKNAYNYLGLIYSQLDDNAQAVGYFSQAIDLKPDEILFCNRGVSYANLGRYPEALTDFNHSLALNPRWGDAYFFMGETLALQKQPQAAAAAYRRFLKLATPANSAATPTPRMIKARKYLQSSAQP